MASEIELFFKDQPIGMVYLPKVDNFDLYGEWKPYFGPILNEFLEVIDNVGEAVVKVGNDSAPMYGTVEVVPDKEISVRLKGL